MCKVMHFCIHVISCGPKVENSFPVDARVSSRTQKKITTDAQTVFYIYDRSLDFPYIYRLLLIAHLGLQKEQRENSSAMRALRRISGKLGDVFIDVMKGYNLMVADDWHS